MLLTGPSQAGKTTLLYGGLIFGKHDSQATTTTGFHFEQIAGGEGLNKQMVGVWDVAGNSPKPLLRQLYQLVKFQALVYVIDPE